MDENKIALNLNDEDQRADEPESDAESEHSVHNTDSEQSGNEENYEEPDPIEPHIPPGMPVYLGKDNVFQWLKHVPPVVGRTRRQNLVTHLPGVKNVARDARSPLECWSLFFPDSVIQQIVDCTNDYLRLKRENFSRERDCKDTDFHEINALIGLLYLAGVKKSQHINIDELWSTDGTAPECFSATMSKRRFYQLLQALRFDRKVDRKDRLETDNLAPIRTLF